MRKVLIAFDNFRQKIILIANMDLSQGEAGYHRAVLELKHMEELIRTGEPCRSEPGALRSPVKALFDKERYCRMVEQGKRHIREGDIFQIVLSNRLEAEFEGSLLNAYRMLRTLNPSPYMFYFSGSDLETAGASPETLVKLEKACFTHSLRQVPGPGERRRRKIWLWRENYWRIPRSWRSTVCWWTWEEMIWEG